MTKQEAVNLAAGQAVFAAVSHEKIVYADAPEGSIGGEFARGYFGP